jgi:hypothetical protein
MGRFDSVAGGGAGVAGDGAGVGVGGGGRADPVFVLCMGRSGSTLLRLILDSHPELACPPETNIPALCSQLAVVWSLIEGAPLSAQRGDAPPVVPDAAVAGIRATMDLMTVPYLARRGKRRYCDKSLGTARYAGLLARIYPGARFICLYRHPMDVISSGLEACPWGLNGYGFDPYIAASPGNAVMALARYWADGAQAIAAVEEQYAGSCHRVRYEEMVADPERVAAGIFGFVGAGQVPGIAEAVFTGDHERFGPADHKIWHTSRISGASVGRSDSVPAGLIPPAVLELINGLADRLGYVRVDERWGTAGMPASLLAAPGDGDGDAPAPGDGPAPGAPGGGEGVRLGGLAAEAAVLAERLAQGAARLGGAAAARWRGRLGEAFTVVIREPGGAVPVWWRVCPGAGTLVTASRPAGGGDGDGGDADWSVVGTGQAWLAVLDGEVNLSVALRRNELRYCDYGEGDGDVFAAEARLDLLCALLGIPSLAGGRAAGRPAVAVTGRQ